VQESLSPDEIKHIVEELAINQPILAYKVVGSRVELHLLGGATAVYRQPDAEAIFQALATLKRKDLRFLAAKFLIRGRGKMNKSQLIDALTKEDARALLAAMDRYGLS
jgi:hypothetical protein